MKMSEWAKREVEIACEKEKKNAKQEENEFDYGCACYKSALKAFESLCEDGHSGYSIGITKYILNRLIDGRPLTPIEDTDDIWDEPFNNDGVQVQQCKRMSSLFKRTHKDGSITYSDVDACHCIDIDNPDSIWHYGIIDSMFPITMPYMPGDPLKVYCSGLSVSEDNDCDAIGVLYAVKPDGSRTYINRYFKTEGTDFVEINRAEFVERRRLANEEQFDNEHRTTD